MGWGEREEGVTGAVSNHQDQPPALPILDSLHALFAGSLRCGVTVLHCNVAVLQIQDTYPYAIALSWKQAGDAAEGEDAAGLSNQIVFSKSNPLPSSKLLTFYRTETFTIDAFYADPQDLPPDYNLRIGTFTVSGLGLPLPQRAVCALL